MADIKYLKARICTWQGNNYSESAINRLSKDIKEFLEMESLSSEKKSIFFEKAVECVYAAQSLHVLKSTGCFKFDVTPAGLVFELRLCLLALASDLSLHKSDLHFLNSLPNAKLIFDETQKLNGKLAQKMRQAIAVFKNQGEYYSFILTLCAYVEHRVVETLQTVVSPLQPDCSYKDRDDLNTYSVPELVDALSLLIALYDEIAPHAEIDGLVYGDGIFTKRLNELFLMACKLRFLQELLASNEVFAYEINISGKQIYIACNTETKDLLKTFRLGYIKRNLAAQNFSSNAELPSLQSVIKPALSSLILEKAEFPNRYLLRVPDILISTLCSVNDLSREEYDSLNFEVKELNLNIQSIDSTIYKSLTLREYLQLRRVFIVFYYAQTVPLYEKFTSGEISRVEYFQSLIPHFSLKHFESWDAAQKQKLQEFWELINYRDTNSTIVDLMYQPCLSSNQVILPLCATSVISNIGRNVAVLMKRLNRGANEDGVDDPLVERMVSAFRRTSIPFSTNCPIRGLTDMDIAFCIEDTIYIAECKKNYHPTDFFECRATLDALYKAERQLNRIIRAIDATTLQTLCNKLQITFSPQLKIVPLIITGNRILSNTNYFKYPVRYFGELIQYIENGTMNLGGQEIPTRTNGPISTSDMTAYLNSNCDCFEFLTNAMASAAQVVTVGTYSLTFSDYALDAVMLDNYCYNRWAVHILAEHILKQLNDSLCD